MTTFLMNIGISLLSVFLLFNQPKTVGYKHQGKQGALIGLITDNSTGKPLSGVKVELVGTRFSTLSNSEGKFRIGNIPLKSYSAKFSSEGFQQLEIRSVMPGAGDTVNVRLQS